MRGGGHDEAPAGSAADAGGRIDTARVIRWGRSRAWRATGDYPAAARDLEQALAIYRDLGDRGGEAEALNERGTLHQVSGELTQAQGCHQQALELARAIAISWDEAHALAGLGRCALAVGHADEAADRLRQALEIFQRIGAAEAADVSAELGALPIGSRPRPDHDARPRPGPDAAGPLRRSHLSYHGATARVP